MRNDPAPRTGSAPAACRRALLTASARADGEASLRAMLALDTHMAGCRPCAAAARDIDDVIGMIESVPQIELEAELEDRLLQSVLERTAALPAPRPRRRGHLRLVGLPLAAGLIAAGLGRGLVTAWGGSDPSGWSLPIPRALLDRLTETVAAAARLAVEEIARLILRAPEISPPALIPEVGSIGWILLLSVFLSSLAMLAMMTHLFWRDVLIWLGIHQNRDR